MPRVLYSIFFLRIWVLALIFAAAGSVEAQFTIASPTTQWVVVQYPPGATTDYFTDQQTGSGEADIVGGGLLPSFYTKYITGGTPTTGTVYFRIRMGADDGSPGFDGACFLGVDANADGKLDVFFGVNNSGSSDGIYIWTTGNDLNISPSTTSIDSNNPLYTSSLTAANYHWAPVTVTLDPAATTPALLNTDGRTNGDQTDRFLSFSLPFASVVSALNSAGVSGVTDTTVMRYVMGTATQANSFNQDLNGVNGGVKSTLPWSELGAITVPLTPEGTPPNTPPVNTVLGAQSVARSATIAISGVSSADAENNLATVQLSVSRGVLQVSVAGGASISAGASGSPSLTLTGTATQINAALATLSYTAPVDYSGPAVLTVLATDTASATDSDPINITVLPNQPPLAANDSTTTVEDFAVTFPVLGNDTDPDGGTLLITGASVTGGGGTVAVNPNSTLTFTPALNFNGPATLTYSISDGQGGTTTATVTITVTPANDAPVAANDFATTNEDIAATVAVLANDADIDGDSLSVTAANLTGGSGTVAFNNSSVTFTPALNFFGAVTISYVISDGNGGTASAQINVTILPVNDAPVGTNDAKATQEDTATSIAVLANDTDIDGNPLTVTSVTVNPAQGTATVNPDFTVTFTPTQNFHGTATITYFISDGQGGTASAIATITVTPVNDAPQAVNDLASTGRGVPVTFSVLANDFDVDGDPLRLTSASVNPALGTVQVNPNSTVTFTPVLTFTGQAIIAYAITDDAGGTANGSATVNVIEGNLPPIAGADTATTNEDLSVNIVVLGNDSDPDGDPLTVSNATVPPGQGSIVVNANNTLTFTPALNFHGTAAATYTVRDNFGGTATAPVTITVTPVNDLPVALDDATTTNEDIAKLVSVLTNDSDIDGDSLTVTSAIVTSGQGNAVVNAGASITFTPAPNFHGSATILYSIADGNGGTASATVTISVLPVNDVPVAVNDAATVNEDTSATVPVLANDSDADGDALSVSSALVTSGQGIAIVNPDKTVTFTPVANFKGQAVVTYFITDGNGGTGSATITITVTSENDPPLAANDTATTNEDTPASIAVLANDTDIDGDPLTVTAALVTSGSGNAAISNGTNVIFTPADAFHGPATISYSISDGQGGSASATITIEVTPVNDAPVAMNDAKSTLEDTATNIVVLTNDTDIDGDPLSVTSATVNPAQGTATVNPDSTLTFTPALNFNGIAAITYFISDGQGGTASAIATITVIPANDAPQAVNDLASTGRGIPVTFSVLVNDFDVDGDPLRVTDATVNPAFGTVQVNPNSTLTFTPVLTFTGEAIIAYAITDDAGGTANASATVNVIEGNLPPIAGADSAIVPEDLTTNIVVLSNDSDPDGDPLTVINATVPPGQGSIVVNAGNTLTFTPPLNFHGTIAATYTVRDNFGGTATAPVTITVTPVNDLPVALDDATTTNEDIPKVVSVLTNDSDVDGDSLTVTSAIVTSGQGAATINAGASITFTPTQNFHGTATVLYAIADGNGGTASATVTIIVLPVNDVPVAVNDAATISEDTTATIPVLINDSDADGDVLYVSSALVTSGQGIAIVNPDKTVTFTPVANFKGQAVVTYFITDGNGGTGSAMINITVTSENDPPIAANDTATTNEDTSVNIAVLTNDSDTDGDPLTVTAALVTSGFGNAAISNGTTVTFTPATDFHGSATISYSISDGQGGSASATIAIEVTPVNDAPLARDDAATTPEDTAVTVHVLVNDEDTDGDDLILQSASVPVAQGMVQTNPDGTLTFTPAQDFHGVATIDYTIADGQGGTDSAQVTVTVLPANDPPVAANDIASTSEGTAATIPVLANDSDTDGDALTVTAASVPPAQGTVTVNLDGTLAFAPALNFHGTTLIAYTIEDGNGGTDSAVVTMTVTPVNELPVPANDSARTPEGRSILVDVLENDVDADGTELSVASTALQSGLGTATITPEGLVEFTPATGFIGLAVISYTVEDVDGGKATAFVLVTVDGLPIAVNDVATTPLDTPVAVQVLANDADPEGTPLTVSNVAVNPLLGTAVIQADGSVLFTPIQGVTGEISMIYGILDEGGNAAFATARVTVGAAISTVPLAVADSATTESITPVTISVLTNDSDPNGSPLTVTTASVNSTAGSVQANANGTLTFTAAPDFVGIATIHYTIANATGGTASAPVLVTVVASNAAPIAMDDFATAAAGSPKVLFVLNNDFDVDGDALAITAASVDPLQGLVSINAGNTLTFTSAPGFLGSASIQYSIEDGRGGTATGTATVLVAETVVNQPPDAVNDAAFASVNVPCDLDVLANDSDPDGDALSIIDATLTAGAGTVSINPDGTIHFVPETNFNSIATILYTARDPAGATDTAVVTVNVNDNPLAVTDRAYTRPLVPISVPVLDNDSDPNGNPLSLIEASANPSQGTVAMNPDGTLTFTPVAAFSGQAVLFYTISDGKGATAEGTVLVLVNDAPLLTADVASTEFGVPVTVLVLPNDTDPDGDDLTVFAAVVDPEQGTIVVNPDGTVTFTPASTFTGPAIITYFVEDTNGSISSSTVTIARRNAAPTADGRLVYTYCGTSLLVNPRRTALDADGDSLSAVAVSQPSRGTAAIMPDGYVRYTPGRLFKGNVTDSFIVTLSDGKGGTTETQITVRSFDRIAGTFQGLLENAAPITPFAPSESPTPYRGRLTATMNGRASFSAKLEVDGKIVRWTGRLTGALQSQRNIKIGNQLATVTLAYHDLTDSWTLSVEGPSLALAGSGNILRSVKSGRSKVANYNLSLTTNSSSLASNPSSASLSVRPNGVASVVGRLPNGNRFTAGARLDAAGRLPICRWLGPATALEAPTLSGRLELIAPTNDQICGSLVWRPDAPAGMESLEVQGAIH